MSIFNPGGRVVDTLHLTNSTQYGFVVEKIATSVNIVALTEPGASPVGLPIHS